MKSLLMRPDIGDDPLVPDAQPFLLFGRVLLLFFFAPDPSLCLRLIHHLLRQLTRQGIVTPNGHTRWNSATVRGILTNPSYTGQVYAGRTQPCAPRIRRSALLPLGRPSTTDRPTPPLNRRNERPEFPVR